MINKLTTLKLSTYYHTLKYLKTSQIYHRIVKRFVHPKVHALAGVCAPVCGEYVPFELYEQKLFENGAVRFLNADGVCANAADWNDESQAKLWLYNLHYFDDLNAIDASSRSSLQVEFIDRWIAQNPAGFGNGWEPYTVSLRIVNWVKGFLGHISPSANMLNSLACQADYLSQDLERHILGNHLFVNAKALIFAGLYLSGDDANTWLKLGLNIYCSELDEQVLGDGGNFELAPMYHAIMLVDLLDLLNVFNVYANKVTPEVINKTKAVAIKMLNWLSAMSHCDGKISFFNDSTFAIAASNELIADYANKLGLNYCPQVVKELSIQHLESTGYVCVKNENFSLIADLAAVGPDYIPGHAHADSLSFELCINKQRVFVNSGISEYGLSAERLRQRETPAHNTVSINGLSSSQVWSGFRVAKRARIIEKQVGKLANGKVSFTAAHNGFKVQGFKCVHQRKWQVSDSRIIVSDVLKGTFNKAEGYLHLHPSIKVADISNTAVTLLGETFKLTLNAENANIRIEQSSWHPEFGQHINSQTLCFSFIDKKMNINMQWVLD